MLTPDEELAAHARERVGTWLRDKYRIDRVLGIGGMGSVYGATHRNGRQVAIKLLHPEYSVRADLRRRFLRESQAANAVHHPGVVAIIDDDVADDGAAFLVMELLDGQNVEELWESHGKRLSERAVLALAADLCAVLAAAHDAGVIHRDLKPANLFVTHAGELKVLDFGIARVRDATTVSATTTGSVFGTPAFMPPEQASGLVNELGPMTDVWAVGATMFTLLSGRTVHEGQSGQHIAILAATTPARSLATVMPDASNEVIAIVDRALAFDKADRWSSATALRDALCDALKQLEATNDDPLVRGTLSETMLAIAGVKPVVAHSGTLACAGERPPVLGGTTGQPVSSGTITQVERLPRNGSAWERSRTALGRWVRMSKRRHLLAALGVAIIGVLGAGMIRSAEFGNLRNAADVRTQALPDENLPTAVTAPEPTPANEPGQPTLPATSASNAPRPARSATVRIKTPAPRPRSGSTPQLDCNPPFVVQDGIQVHKPGCP